jgi:uncharacterized membrane protein YhhN
MMAGLMSADLRVRRLAVLGGAAVFAFALGLALDVPPLRLATKALPALCLAAWILPARARGARWIASGLAFSAVGDLALELGDRPPFFLAGMLAFALAHAAYVAGFVAVSRVPRVSWLLPFAFWGAGLLALVRPGLGPMTAPVAVYALLLVAMMWRAAATGRAEAALGAILFGCSDSLIALNRFHAPVPAAAWLIMALYWLGQWGIARSVSRA